MSWLNHLLPFATGFVHGLVEGIAAVEPDGPAAHRGYRSDFRQQIFELADATGIQFVKVRDRDASFSFLFEGETHFASVISVNDLVSLAVFSKIEFPLRRVPPDVVHKVRRASASLPNCDFELVDLDDCSVWCAKGMATATVLTPRVFGAAVAELATCVARLDTWIVDRGFAS